MSIKQKIKVKTFTGSGSFDVREEMIKDSTDLLDNVEVTTIAQECVKLKAKSLLLLEREKITRHSNCWTLQQRMGLNHNRNLMWPGLH